MTVFFLITHLVALAAGAVLYRLYAAKVITAGKDALKRAELLGHTVQGQAKSDAERL